MTNPAPSPTGSRHVELALLGLSCANCANHVQRTLNKLAGVECTVNYATESASLDAANSYSAQDLIDAVKGAGYDARLLSDGNTVSAADADKQIVAAEQRANRDLVTRLIVAAVLAIPVMVISMTPGAQFPGWQWVCLALSTVVVFYPGWLFHRATIANAKHHTVSMDTLLTLGTLAAYLWSLGAMLFGTAGHIGMHHSMQLWNPDVDPSGQVYFESASGVILFLLLGRYVEHRAKRSARAGLSALMDVGAKDALFVDEQGDEHRIPVASLCAGDLFRVLPGDKIATDGEVIEGISSVNASAMTGESIPQSVAPGDSVIGGCINTTGTLLVRATAVGADTQLAAITDAVKRAQESKSHAQRLADRISSVFVPIVIALAFLALAGHLIAGESAAAAFTAGVAVLIIACPCALGLATPLAFMVGTGRAAQRGIIVRSQETLEKVRDINTVVFDKTGTITTGEMSVSEVLPVEGMSATDMLALAAAVEYGSEHPIGAAIVKAATQRREDSAEQTDSAMPTAQTVQTVRAHNISAIPGEGVQGDLPDGTAFTGTVFVGKPRDEVGRAALRRAASAHGVAASHVAVYQNDTFVGSITVADTVKPTSADAIAKLHQQGCRTILLTGDNYEAAQQIAAEVGISASDVIADVLPTQKADRITELQQGGNTVAMVGDGINDAAALALSHLGIAMGTGTDVAMQAADLTLVRGDVEAVPEALHLARRMNRIVRGNLFWAFIYNVAMIPLAMLGFLNPMMAGLAMVCSDLFVVGNSLRLRWA